MNENPLQTNNENLSEITTINIHDRNDTNYNSLEDSASEISLNECFICMEGEVNGHIPIKISKITSINGNCECDALIHPSCYAEWVVANMSCPICREPVHFVDVVVDETINFNEQPDIVNTNEIKICNQKLNKQTASMIFVFFSIFFVFLIIMISHKNSN